MVKLRSGHRPVKLEAPSTAAKCGNPVDQDQGQHLGMLPLAVCLAAGRTLMP
jgi:hypothetical protein